MHPDHRKCPCKKCDLEWALSYAKEQAALIPSLEARLDALDPSRLALKALMAVEWVSGSCYEYCFWCKNNRINGHQNDCIGRRAIAALEGNP